MGLRGRAQSDSSVLSCVRLSVRPREISICSTVILPRLNIKHLTELWWELGTPGNLALLICMISSGNFLVDGVWSVWCSQSVELDIDNKLQYSALTRSVATNSHDVNWLIWAPAGITGYIRHTSLCFVEQTTFLSSWLLIWSLPPSLPPGLRIPHHGATTQSSWDPRTVNIHRPSLAWRDGGERDCWAQSGERNKYYSNREHSRPSSGGWKMIIGSL